MNSVKLKGSEKLKGFVLYNHSQKKQEILIVCDDFDTAYKNAIRFIPRTIVSYFERLNDRYFVLHDGLSVFYELRDLK